MNFKKGQSVADALVEHISSLDVSALILMLSGAMADRRSPEPVRRMGIRIIAARLYHLTNQPEFAKDLPPLPDALCK